MAHSSMVISVMTIGKRIRMERIKDRKSGNSLIIPLDHGISEGPIKGIVGLADTMRKSRKAERTPCSSRRAWFPTVIGATAGISASSCT